MHSVVPNARAVRTAMIANPEVIATDSGKTTRHCHASDMDASAERSQMGAAYARPSTKAAEMSAPAKTADVRASAKSAHVPATAETSAAMTATAATAPRIGRAHS